MSLFFRLLFLIAVAILPAIAIHAYDAWELRERGRREVVDDALRLLGLLQTEQQRAVEGIRQVLATARETRALREGDRLACQEFLERVKVNLTDHHDIYATNADGLVICGSRAGATGVAIGDRSHFKLAMQTGGFSVGDYVVGRASGEALLPFAVPYRLASGEFGGVITMTLSLGWLSDYLAGQPLPLGTSVTLADRTGTILVRLPAEKRWIGRQLPFHYRDFLHGTRPGVGEVVGLDGKDRVLAYSPVGVGLPGLFMSVGLDKSVHFAALERQTARGLVLLFVNLALAVSFAWFLYGRLLKRPVAALLGAAESWRRGDYDRRVSAGSGSHEFARLGKAFNTMAAALADREREAEEAAALERRMAAVLASTTDGVYEIDRDWRILFMNDRARASIAGGADMIGQALWEAYPEAAGSVFEREFRRAAAERVPVEFEAHYAPLGGWYWVRAFPTEQDGLAVYFQDITARKAAEGQLAEVDRAKSEALAQLESLLVNAPVGFAFFDRQHRYVRINQALAEINGIPAEDHLGRAVAEVLPINAQSVDPVVEHVFRSGEAVADIEITGETPRQPGTPRHWLCSFYPVTVEGGTEYVGAVVMEITAQKQAQEELGRSRSLLSLVLEALPVGVWVLDEHGRVSNLNPAARRIWGEDRALGSMDLGAFKGWWRATGVPLAARDWAAARAFDRGEVSLNEEINIETFDGQRKTILNSALPIRNGGGRIVGAVAVNHDITASKVAEAALKTSEERFRRALFYAPFPMMLHAEDGEVLGLSRAWQEITGYRLEDVPTIADWTARAHGEHSGAVRADFERLFEQRDWRDEGEYVVRTAKGSERVWAFRSSPVGRDERGRRLVVTMANDVTEARQAEAELRASQQALIAAKEEAERANLAKSGFLAAASHDLRQPVQSMMLMLGVLAKQLDDHPAQGVVGHLDRALDALRSLLDGLLDISKLDAGVVVPAIQNVGIEELLRSLGEEYGLRAAEKGLAFRMVACKATVRTDPVLLQRILRNLLENALRYTAVGRVLLGCRRRGDVLDIEVRDTGIGIPQNQLAAIFEEFHQLGNPERDRAQGLGLGLAIVRRLALLLGHHVEVVSHVGRGSCFKIAVPLGNAAEMAVQPTSVSSKSMHGLVVIIEDDQMIRAGLASLLRGWDLDVVAAEGGAAAVAGLRGRVPDLVIADYRLHGGFTGSEAVAEVREASEAAVPAIVLTGETDPLHVAAIERSGHLVLHKPVAPLRLKEAVSAALGRSMTALAAK